MKRCPYETCLENLGEICICEEKMQAEIEELKDTIAELGCIASDAVTEKGRLQAEIAELVEMLQRCHADLKESVTSWDAIRADEIEELLNKHKGE